MRNGNDEPWDPESQIRHYHEHLRKLDDSKARSEFAQKALRYQFIYSSSGLFLGFSAMVIGGWLLLSGVSGKTNVSAKLFGADTQLTDAAPGTVLFFVGLFFVIATKLKIKAN